MKTSFQHPLIESVKKELYAKKDIERAAWSKAYMKNQFSFIGLVAAERRIITKKIVKEIPIHNLVELEKIVRVLWQKDAREFQYVAIEILAFHKKMWNKEIIELLEFCITSKSWWDSVDHIIIECLGYYFKQYQEEINNTAFKWNQSSNIWLQRCSILFQKSYKQQTDTTILSKYILHHANSKEFFVQKAIGWALREYARTNEIWVKTFVANHLLPALSKREAMKHL
ncbi:MAG: DNA alkylation repair protein [Chitinophagaceae bacterium]